MSNALGAFRVEPANALKPEPNLSSHNYRLSAYERLSDLYPERYPSADGYVTNQPLDATEAEHLRCAFALAGAGCTAIITNTPHNTAEACAIVRNLVALVEGKKSNLPPPCSGRSGALSQDDWRISTGRPSPAKSFVGTSVDSGDQKKSDARIRVVRLAEGATERSVFEGSRRQARNYRDPISSEPANARLTAETKPFRGRKTSQPAYSHSLF